MHSQSPQVQQIRKIPLDEASLFTNQLRRSKTKQTGNMARRASYVPPRTSMPTVSIKELKASQEMLSVPIAMLSYKTTTPDVDFASQVVKQKGKKAPLIGQSNDRTVHFSFVANELQSPPVQ